MLMNSRDVIRSIALGAPRLSMTSERLPIRRIGPPLSPSVYRSIRSGVTQAHREMNLLRRRSPRWQGRTATDIAAYRPGFAVRPPGLLVVRAVLARNPPGRLSLWDGQLPDSALSRKNVQEYSKLSVLDVCRLSHSRLQIDHLAIHSEPVVSVDGGWSSDPFAPNWSLEHFKDEEIVLVDEAGTAVQLSPIGEVLVDLVRCTSTIWSAGGHEVRRPVFAAAGNHQNNGNQTPDAKAPA
jgi:hypothetical protein